MRVFRLVPLITVALFAACRTAESRIDAVDGSLGSRFPGTQQGAASETSDVRFLKALADHREGVMHFALATVNQTSREITRSDAQKLHMKQLRELDSLRNALATFETHYAPVVAPRYKAMADSVAAQLGEARDAAFYREAIKLHQDAVRLVETHLPQLRDARVLALARRTKSDDETALLRLTTRRR